MAMSQTTTAASPAAAVAACACDCIGSGMSGSGGGGGGGATGGGGSLSDLIVTIAYFSIPVQILCSLYKYPRLARMPPKIIVLLILFAFFIFLCGAGHLMRFIRGSGGWNGGGSSSSSKPLSASASASDYRYDEHRDGDGEFDDARHGRGYGDDYDYDFDSSFRWVNGSTAVVSLITALYLLPLIPNLLGSLDDSLRELVKMNHETEESKNKLVSFMAFLCHEIRNPLFAITSSASFLGDTDLTEEQRIGVGSIYDSSLLMLRLVNDVLDLSKIDAGKLELERRTFDLRAMLGNLETNMRMQISQKHRDGAVVFGFTVGVDVPRFVHGDSIRILQIIYNLLSNSSKFTKAGRIDFSVGVLGDDDTGAAGCDSDDYDDDDDDDEEENGAIVGECTRQTAGARRRRSLRMGRSLGYHQRRKSSSKLPLIHRRFDASDPEGEKAGGSDSFGTADTMAASSTYTSSGGGCSGGAAVSSSMLCHGSANGSGKVSPPPASDAYSVGADDWCEGGGGERERGPTDALLDAAERGGLPGTSYHEKREKRWRGMGLGPGRVGGDIDPDGGGGGVAGGGDHARYRLTTLVIKVADTGIGIDEDRIETIFQPYSQAKLSDYRKHGGTGLGLSIVSSLVRLMGGSIEVKSRVGDGSCFTLLLPVGVPDVLDRYGEEDEDEVEGQYDNRGGSGSGSGDRGRSAPGAGSDDPVHPALFMPEGGVGSIEDMTDPYLSCRRLPVYASVNSSTASSATNAAAELSSSAIGTIVDTETIAPPSGSMRGDVPVLIPVSCSIGCEGVGGVTEDPNRPDSSRAFRRNSAADEAGGGEVGMILSDEKRGSAAVAPLLVSRMDGAAMTTAMMPRRRSSAGDIAAGSGISAENEWTNPLPTNVALRSARCCPATPSVPGAVVGSDGAFDVSSSIMASKKKKSTLPTFENLPPRECVVLVVDDNCVNRKIVGRMLSYFRIEYEEALNGQEAVDMVRRSRNHPRNGADVSCELTASSSSSSSSPSDPTAATNVRPVRYSLVFMDLSMPVLDGFEAIRTLRSEGVVDLPIVALTANALDQERKRALEAGANEFHTKPILRGDVHTLCARYLCPPLPPVDKFAPTLSPERPPMYPA